MRLIDADALLQHQTEADKMGAMLVVGKGFIMDATTITPQPDPDTGLVPCGCGGRPEVRWGSTMLDSTHVSVWCIDCMVGTYGFYEEENKAKDAWNRAMGWKGDAE